MLAGTRLEVFRDWWLPLAPAGAFFLAILGFTLLGEGLRAVLDPYH
jgi:peptide/nickel transport system permease protein